MDALANNFLIIYVDGDACPVKNEIYRVAERHKIFTKVISNSLMSVPNTSLIELTVVSKESDAVDDWIVEHILKGDIVVTADIPLAARCIEKNAKVLCPNGKVRDPQNIGSDLAMRDLMEDIRITDEIRQMHKPFSKQDRIRFLNALEKMIQIAKRSDK